MIVSPLAHLITLVITSPQLKVSKLAAPLPSASLAALAKPLALEAVELIVKNLLPWLILRILAIGPRQKQALSTVKEQ